MPTRQTYFITPEGEEWLRQQLEDRPSQTSYTRYLMHNPVNVLLALSKLDISTSREVARHISMPYSKAQTVIQRLVRKGLVQRGSE